MPHKKNQQESSESESDRSSSDSESSISYDSRSSASESVVSSEVSMAANEIIGELYKKIQKKNKKQPPCKVKKSKPAPCPCPSPKPVKPKCKPECPKPCPKPKPVLCCNPLPCSESVTAASAIIDDKDRWWKCGECRLLSGFKKIYDYQKNRSQCSNLPLCKDRKNKCCPCQKPKDQVYCNHFQIVEGGLYNISAQIYLEAIPGYRCGSIVTLELWVNRAKCCENKDEKQNAERLAFSKVTVPVACTTGVLTNLQLFVEGQALCQGDQLFLNLCVDQQSKVLLASSSEQNSTFTIVKTS